MNSTLIVSPSPHVHSGDSIGKNMYGVLIALVPAFLVSLYCFGLGALIVKDVRHAISVAPLLATDKTCEIYFISNPLVSSNPNQLVALLAQRDRKSVV